MRGIAQPGGVVTTDGEQNFICFPDGDRQVGRPPAIGYRNCTSGPAIADFRLVPGIRRANPAHLSAPDETPKSAPTYTDRNRGDKSDITRAEIAYPPLSFSTAWNSSLRSSSSPRAIRRIISRVGLPSPLSSVPMYVRWTSMASAKLSCEYPIFLRSALTVRPKRTGRDGMSEDCGSPLHCSTAYASPLYRMTLETWSSEGTVSRGVAGFTRICAGYHSRTERAR